MQAHEQVVVAGAHSQRIVLNDARLFDGGGRGLGTRLLLLGLTAPVSAAVVCCGAVGLVVCGLVSM